MCSLCQQQIPLSEGAECRSCLEEFCDDCFDQHFTAGPHIVIAEGSPTDWHKESGQSWPRKLMGAFTYQSDGTGRDIWIPAIEPEEWQ